METHAHIVPVSQASVAHAADLLRSGRAVSMPAETVYLAAADARQDKGLEALFMATGGPGYAPLTVVVHEIKTALELAIMGTAAYELAETLWPGPLTMILPRRPSAALAPLFSPNRDTIALGVPAHPVTRAVLTAFGGPLAVSSANRAGTLCPTTPLHVADGLGHTISLILAGGRATIGIETTVLDLTAEPPRLLRPGPIAGADLATVAGTAIATLESGAPRRRRRTRLPVRLMATAAGEDEALVTFGTDRFVRGGAQRLNLSPAGDLNEAAANLYAMLRTLDHGPFAGIAVMPIPDQEIGIAINHRLRRIAGHAGQGEQT